MANVEHIFQKKALILHIFLSVLQPIICIVGYKGKISLKKENDVDGMIDWEFIQQIETPKFMISVFLTVLGLILDICACKDRKYASLIIYLEIV